MYTEKRVRGSIVVWEKPVAGISDVFQLSSCPTFTALGYEIIVSFAAANYDYKDLLFVFGLGP